MDGLIKRIIEKCGCIPHYFPHNESVLEPVSNGQLKLKILFYFSIFDNFIKQTDC